MVKVLFLDIDGVLNSAFVLAEQRRADAIDRDMVERINRIVDATGCFIVVSSAWRLYTSYNSLVDLLTSHGLRNVIIDTTPHLDESEYNRADEIRTWLDKTDIVVTSIAIIDDFSGALTSINDRVVLTTWDRGTEDIHVDQAIKLLNE
jgi:Swiss Army Knife RNA repair-like protein